MNFILKIAETDLDNLREIVCWPNLSIAVHAEFIWLKGFTKEQLDSIEVRTIPFKEVYTLQNELLTPILSKLPDSRMPTLVWKPIKQEVPIRISSFNQNYFGIDGEINIELIKDTSSPPSFLRVSLDILGNYLLSASSVRLRSLKWSNINNTHALIQGIPLLSLYGDLYWQQNNMLFPNGYNLNLPILEDVICQEITPENRHYIMWNKDGSYSLIEKTSFMPLSISSFRKTLTIL